MEEIPPVKKAEGVRYRFVICDTGIGMTREFLSRIFESFARSRTAAQIEGIGLGLSITKGLVDLMDGSILIESAPYCGSTFQVLREFEVVPEGELRESSASDMTLNKENLFHNCSFLIAEDNAINAEILNC